VSSLSSAVTPLDTENIAARSIYKFMAILFVTTAIVGFAPSSLLLVFMVYSGQRPMPPPTLHIHAAVMTLWLLLFFAQAFLVAKKRHDLHFKLGLTSLVLAPVIWGAMISIVASRSDSLALLPPDADPGQITAIKQQIANGLLINGGSILLFPVFYLAAVVARNVNSETHKRMMVLATLVLMVPAIGRMLILWLPDFGLLAVDSRHVYMLLLLTPALIDDIKKRGAPHRSYLVGLALLGCYVVAAHFLWGTAWWLATASKLTGIG
jgi:hypothetical protein